jgi:osmotically-inducible protein OsmY
MMKNLTRILAASIFAITLLNVVSCASTKKQEGTGEYVDDSVITTKVKAQLFDEPGIRSSQIDVDTYKGVVQLSGFVNSQADIDKAIAIVHTIDGVKSVRNQMRVR